jgi:hypothetical protein
MLTDTDVEATEWIHKVDDKILACRGQGHDWPKLPIRSSRKLVRGVWSQLIPDTEGQAEIHFICKGCGKERWMVTRPRGVLELPARYRYVDPDGYKGPKGVPISRRACFEESWRRAVEGGLMEVRG